MRKFHGDISLATNLGCSFADHMTYHIGGNGETCDENLEQQKWDLVLLYYFVRSSCISLWFGTALWPSKGSHFESEARSFLGSGKR